MSHSIPEEYRQPFLGELDPEFRRFLSASATLGALVLLIVLAAPQHQYAITEVAQVPERFARLILKEPKPEAAKSPAPSVQKAPEVEPAPPPPPPKVRRQQTPPVAPNAGEVGRAKAKKAVSASLAGATKSADSAIKNLTSSLGKNTTATRPKARSRRRNVSRGRATEELTSVQHREGGSGTAADIAGSSVAGSLISIESVSYVAEGGSQGGPSTEAGSASPSSYRSNASLLAVVRRYAAGVQFCYDNELKRAPGLRGKLVAALTVTASGEVADVRVVSDTVKSSRLSQCVLSQIREWKFPAVREGTTVFKAPFVFTPPKG